MTKIKNAVINHKYFILFFAVLTLYAFGVVNKFKLPYIDDVLYTFYLLDFSFGFCTKFLPGAIYNLFVSSPTPQSARVFAAILLLLIFAAVSVLLEKLIKKINKNERNTVLLLCIFFVTGPATFSVFSYCYGMIDTWWVVFSVLFLVLLNTKYARFTLPLLFILSIMVHEGAMVTYVLLFALLILYEAVLAPKGSKARKTVLVIFLVSVFAAVFTFVYFLVFGKNNAVYGIEDFIRILSESGSDNSFNLAYSMYGNGQTPPDIFVNATGIGEEYSSAYFTELVSAEKYPFIAKFINAIWNQAQLHWLFYTQKNMLPSVLFKLAGLLILILPLVALFYKYIIIQLKNSKDDKLKAFTYFCMLFLMPSATVLTIMLSIDSVKWTSHGFIMLFTLFLYMLYKDTKPCTEFILQSIKNIKPVFIIIYFAIYFTTVINPYT